MNLREARVAFRDRTVSDVLDLALRFLSVNGRVYARSASAPCSRRASRAPPRSRVRLGALVGIFDPARRARRGPFTLLASRLVFEDDVRARDFLKASIGAAPRVLLRARRCTPRHDRRRVRLLLHPGIGFAALTLSSARRCCSSARVHERLRRAQRVAQNAFGEVVVAILVIALLSRRRGGPGRRGRAHPHRRGPAVRPPRAMWTDGGSALATIGLFLQVPFLATARFFSLLERPHPHRGWDIQTRFRTADRPRPRGCGP